MKKFKNSSCAGLVSIGLMCLLFLFMSSCVKDNNNSYVVVPTALLMVTQASPDAPAEDFYLNNNLVNHGALQYGYHIDYFNAYTGKRNAILYNYGTMTKIASDTITLKANIAYSLFLANTYTSPDFILLTDSINRPSAGNASIRFVDVSPDAGAVDLASNSTTVLVSNKSYKGYSSFTPLKGNTMYNFEVRQAGTNTVLATLDSVTVNTGFVYTIWLHGLAAGSGTSKLSAGIINNAQYY